MSQRPDERREMSFRIRIGDDLEAARAIRTTEIDAAEAEALQPKSRLRRPTPVHPLLSQADKQHPTPDQILIDVIAAHPAYRHEDQSVTCLGCDGPIEDGSQNGLRFGNNEEFAAHLAAAVSKALTPQVVRTWLEFVALPHGVLVQSSGGTVACRVDDENATVPGTGATFPWRSLKLPVTVLSRPAAGGTA